MAIRIFWCIVLGFTLGVFARSFLNFGWWTIGFFVFLAVVILVVAWTARTPVRAAVVPAIFFLCVSLGAARMQMAAFEGDPALDVWVGEKVIIEGVVVDEPDSRENNIRVPIRVALVASTTVNRSVSVLVIAPLHTEIAYGDRVCAEGKLRLPEQFETGVGRAFNYPSFLVKDGIGYELAFAHVERVGDNEGNPIKAVSIWIKQTYLHGLTLSLPEPQAGLAGGITVGDKRGIGATLSETFRTVGLTHIIVLSGYNIMIVIIGLSWVLARTHASPWVRFGVGVFVAIFFALITGLASASVRAAAMAIIAMVGQVSGRMYLASRALGAVAFGIVLWNPYVLAFDPGFQLSVIATAGLIAFSPLIASRLSFVTEKFALREITATTVATQITVLPFLLYQSGQFSLYALPVNLLVLATVPFAMLFSAIAAMSGLMTGPLAPIVGLPAYMLLSYGIFIAKFFAALPFAAVPVSTFSVWWMFVAYAALAGGYWLIQKRAARPEASPQQDRTSRI